MKPLIFVVVVLSIAVIALPAYAGLYSCTGTVTMLFINGGNGGVVVQGPGGLPPILLCSVTTATTNFAVDGCKTAYATLLAAKLSGQTAQVNFNDSLTCSTQPTWGSTGYTSAWSVQTQ